MILIKPSQLIFLVLILPILTKSPLINSEPVNAWAARTHGWLSEVAIRLMPSPWDTRLNNYLQFFHVHSEEPDIIRHQASGVEYMKEAARHHVDADVRPDIYGNATHHPQPEFDMTYNSDDPRKSSDYQLGVAPWAVENWTIRLSEDLLIYDWDSEKILMDMCMLAHYLQDSWMPFHAVSYYDGQKVPVYGPDAGLFYKGGQKGIHNYIEKDLIENLYTGEINDILEKVTGEAQHVNPYMASLRGILTGQAVADEILNVVDVYGYTFGDNTWLRAVWDLTGDPEGNLTKRLINASIETANVWYTAFKDAGLIEKETTTSTAITTTTTTTTKSQTSVGSTDLSNLELIVIASLTGVSILTIIKRRKI
ncbi:MAG: hypothetical protein JSU57_06020 [Candidatus Heimdallarchaeota archaeon]|nr:MAG: hypothetical protein JSU57_06020 [Candidatus Heimdallarchaeota archaeon]